MSHLYILSSTWSGFCRPCPVITPASCCDYVVVTACVPSLLPVSCHNHLHPIIEAYIPHDLLHPFMTTNVFVPSSLATSCCDHLHHIVLAAYIPLLLPLSCHDVLHPAVVAYFCAIPYIPSLPTSCRNSLHPIGYAYLLSPGLSSMRRLRGLHLVLITYNLSRSPTYRCHQLLELRLSVLDIWLVCKVQTRSV